MPLEYLPIMAQKSAAKPPRAAFVDHPVGRTFGPTNDRPRNQAVLTRALAELPNFARPGEIHDLGCNWSRNANRAWEGELRAEMLRDR